MSFSFGPTEAIYQAVNYVQIHYSSNIANARHMEAFSPALLALSLTLVLLSRKTPVTSTTKTSISHLLPSIADFLHTASPVHKLTILNRSQLARATPLPTSGISLSHSGLDGALLCLSATLVPVVVGVSLSDLWGSAPGTRRRVSPIQNLLLRVDCRV